MPEKIDHTAILDRMRPTELEARALKKRVPRGDVDSLEILGFRFKRGQKVLDSVTGEEVEVLDGVRVQVKEEE